MKMLTGSLCLFLALGFLTLGTVGAQPPAPAGPPKAVAILDPTFAEVLSPDAVLKTVFLGKPNNGSFFEGPTWVPGRPGHLIFTDIPNNVIYQLGPDGTASVVVDNVYIGDSATRVTAPAGANAGAAGRANTGAAGANAGAAGRANTGAPPRPRLTGPDGTAVDKEGRITYVEYGGGRVIRVEKDGSRTVLAKEFEGKRFNAPDDLVFKSDGSLYFTDLLMRTPGPEFVPFGGVYRIKDGKLELMSKDFRPNGIAFSPDEKYLYITDSPRKIVRFDVKRDGTLANGHVFVDIGSDPRPGSPDGLKIDKDGNVYTEGPGGVWIWNSVGKNIATLFAPVRQFINFTFGGDDGKTLYLTSPEALYSLEFKTPRR
jgi:gluconolactonase